MCETLTYRSHKWQQKVSGSRLCDLFAVGFQQKIKINVSGAEGTFKQLLAKAKFEDAELRDIGNATGYSLYKPCITYKKESQFAKRQKE